MASCICRRWSRHCARSRPTSARSPGRTLRCCTALSSTWRLAARKRSAWRILSGVLLTTTGLSGRLPPNRALLGHGSMCLPGGELVSRLLIACVYWAAPSADYWAGAYSCWCSCSSAALEIFRRRAAHIDRSGGALHRERAFNRTQQPCAADNDILLNRADAAALVRE